MRALRVTSKGQVTIPLEVRTAMGILPAETEIEFIPEDNGRWYLKKITHNKNAPSRFRKVHKAAKLRMSTDEIMALTRG